MRRGQKTSAEHVVPKLRSIEVPTAQGKSLSLACKEAEISDQSDYRWRKEYGGLRIDQARTMKDLERENARLRGLVADLSLTGQVLADFVSRSFQPSAGDGAAPRLTGGVHREADQQRSAPRRATLFLAGGLRIT